MSRTNRGGVHLPNALTREAYTEVIASLADAAAVSQGLLEIDAAAGSSPVALDAEDGRAFVLRFTGTLSADKTFTIPATETAAVFIAVNDTAGFNIVIKVAGEAGPGVTVANGESALCFHDDTNMRSLTVGGAGSGGFAASGTAALSAGTTTVSTAAIGPGSVVLLTGQDGGVTGSLYVSARNAGVDFTITSTNGADGGNVGWAIVA